MNKADINLHSTFVSLSSIMISYKQILALALVLAAAKGSPVDDPNTECENYPGEHVYVATEGCSGFFQCVSGVYFGEQPCGVGTLSNMDFLVCDHSYNVDPETCTSIAPPGPNPEPRYDVDDSYLPTQLPFITLVTDNHAGSEFIRFLVFKKPGSAQTFSVPIIFEKQGVFPEGHLYRGRVPPDSMGVVHELAIPGNRQYWDRMYLENQGGTTELGINLLLISIRYANYYDQQATTLMTIVKEQNEILPAGTSSLRLSNDRGRKSFVEEFFTFLGVDYTKLPLVFRDFIGDIGKSGSDSDKYGLVQEQDLSTKTVLWYYNKHKSISGMENAGNHNQVHNRFLELNRLYCYHSGEDEWILRNKDDYSWAVDDSSNFITYEPQAGDYLVRKTYVYPKGTVYGKSMMIFKWINQGHFAWVLEGPFPVIFRPVLVDYIEENLGRDYCVGRIYDNDDTIIIE